MLGRAVFTYVGWKVTLCDKRRRVALSWGSIFHTPYNVLNFFSGLHAALRPCSGSYFGDHQLTDNHSLTG